MVITRLKYLAVLKKSYSRGSWHEYRTFFNRLSKCFIFIFLLLVIFIISTCSSVEKKETGNSFNILLMGDLLIAQKAEEFIYRCGADYPFKKIDAELRKYDIVFANLETSITERGNPYYDKPYVFRLHPENTEYFRNMKFDIFSLANNHLLDFGSVGMEDTISYLEDWGVKYCGAGKNIREARKPAVIRRGNVELLFFAYCGRPPEDFYADVNRPGTAPLDLDMIKEDIGKYKKHNNLVFISLHWGIEHTNYPQRYQVRMAHEIIDAGADVIIGHHVHVPQGIEIYKNRPIIYSLGNVISGYYHYNYKDNLMVALQYNGKILDSINIIPIAGNNSEIHFQPYILKGERAQNTINYLSHISRQFATKFCYKDDKGIIEFNNTVKKISKIACNKKDDNEITD